ncbi:MAG: T9SS type A sorting domain-containing protein [Flavobacteriales bacterium]|jgi:hypothetical protein
MKPNRTKLVLAASGSALLLILSAAYTPRPEKARYHTQGEMIRFMTGGNLPVGDNGLFIGSGKCAGCHGVDNAIPPIANLTSEGVHVSPAEDWRATIMALSARDPFWRAKVAHETSVNPDHAQELVNKCTSCHAPVGRFTALHNGQANYSIEELEDDSLALDGVSCGACHQQRMDNIGQHFSGELFYQGDTLWGPYISSQLDPPLFDFIMTNFVGITPAGHENFPKSETCAGCHSLITHSVDLDGEFTGVDFIEQATYHEWLNSSYNMDDNLQKECQGCHMPRLDEPIIIASGYTFIPGREPFGQHWLVGGNSFMLELMQNRIDELGITANESHFDMVIQRTIYQLQNETATLELTTDDIDGDTARYTVKLSNLAGHKFPSGYPARRAWIEFVVSDDDGNELFHSGALDNQFYIIGEDGSFEPHYDRITSDDQVQIYEMVMGDVNGNPTTVLERAYSKLKDNRLTPLGFSTSHPVYDTTNVVGSALTDPNFNRLNGVEGSGTDEVHFHIPVEGINGNVTVTARLLYQSVPPKWNEELFSVDHPVINQFEQMYWEEGPDPVQVATASTTSLLVGVPNLNQALTLGPNPSVDGRLQVSARGQQIIEIVVYDVRGQLIRRIPFRRSAGTIQLPDPSGTYLIEVISENGRTVRKVLRQ